MAEINDKDKKEIKKAPAAEEAKAAPQTEEGAKKKRYATVVRPQHSTTKYATVVRPQNMKSDVAKSTRPTAKKVAEKVEEPVKAPKAAPVAEPVVTEVKPEKPAVKAKTEAVAAPVAEAPVVSTEPVATEPKETKPAKEKKEVKEAAQPAKTGELANEIRSADQVIVAKIEIPVEAPKTKVVRPARGEQRPQRGDARPRQEGGTFRREGQGRPAGQGQGQRPGGFSGQGRPEGSFDRNGARRGPGTGAPGQGGRPQGNRFGQGGQGGRPDYRSAGFGKDEGFNKDKDADYENNNNRKPAARKSSSSSGGMGFGQTKTEMRGGKATNKKERETREKSKQYGTGIRKEENIKNLSKMKGAAPKKPEHEKEEEKIKSILVGDSITVSDLAEKMKIQPAALIKKMFLKGKIYTINSDLTFEQAEEIAIDYEILCEHEEKVDIIEEMLRDTEDPADTLVTRPPVVCVMGHVDHGKTSLLDCIRDTNVIAREAGGITQHIGAYMVGINNRMITFLDTPGHEAFTAMRMRGAKSTDIAILVVAADDGVMPQTIEAINHAKAAGVEIIVAINKIDKPSANIERVKQELSEYELVPEDWGGSTIFVPVSAKTGQGIDELLEMILLVADVKELKANPNRNVRGLVIEAKLDKGKGPVATILVQKGTLHVGDNITVGSCYGKVRAMMDEKGRKIEAATPSTPVEILGLNDVPNAGEIVISTTTDKEARHFAETFIAQNKVKLLDNTKMQLTLDGLYSQIQAGNVKELNLIIKADVQGSVEAVKQSLMKLSNEEVVVKVIHSGVGAINESDVSLASASNAIIIGFNVRPDVMAKSVADREKVDIKLYSIIYQAIADVEAAMKGMLEPIYEEKVIGHGEIRALFKASGIGVIAGSYVKSGSFTRGCKIRIFRGDEKIYEGELASLKRMKDDVKEVKEGFECGMVFEKFNDVAVEDTIEGYIMVEVPR